MSSWASEPGSTLLVPAAGTSRDTISTAWVTWGTGRRKSKPLLAKGAHRAEKLRKASGVVSVRILCLPEGPPRVAPFRWVKPEVRKAQSRDKEGDNDASGSFRSHRQRDPRPSEATVRDCQGV